MTAIRKTIKIKLIQSRIQCKKKSVLYYGKCMYGKLGAEDVHTFRFNFPYSPYGSTVCPETTEKCTDVSYFAGYTGNSRGYALTKIATRLIPITAITRNSVPLRLLQILRTITDYCASITNYYGYYAIIKRLLRDYYEANTRLFRRQTA